MLAAVAALLVLGHGFLFRTLSHKALSLGLVAGAIILIAIMHFGLLGPAYALFRHRGQKKAADAAAVRGDEQAEPNERNR